MGTITDSLAERTSLVLRRWKRTTQAIALALLRRANEQSLAIATAAELELETGYASGAVRRCIRTILESGCLARIGNASSGVYTWHFGELAKQAAELAANDSHPKAENLAFHPAQTEPVVTAYPARQSSAHLNGEDQETLSTFLGAARELIGGALKKAGRLTGQYVFRGTLKREAAAEVVTTVRAIAVANGVPEEAAARHVVATYIRREQEASSRAWDDCLPLDLIVYRGNLEAACGTFRRAKPIEVKWKPEAAAAPLAADLGAAQVLERLAAVGGAR